MQYRQQPEGKKHAYIIVQMFNSSFRSSRSLSCNKDLLLQVNPYIRHQRMYIQKIFFLSLSKMIWKKNPTFKLNNLRRGTLLFDAISKPHSILFIVVTHCSPDYKGVAIFTRSCKSTGLSVLGADQGGLTRMYVWGTRDCIKLLLLRARRYCGRDVLIRNLQKFTL